MGWPMIARGESALMLAPTGTGKTLAAFRSRWAIIPGVCSTIMLFRRIAKLLHSWSSSGRPAFLMCAAWH
jgi:hypothetical protein